MKGPFGSEYIPAHRPEGSTPQYGSGSLAPFQGKTVLIDNYDSFTYNIVEYLTDLGADVVVFRNDKVSVHEITELKPRNLVISPGPGHPLKDSGVSMEAILYFAGKIPIFGVCMGLQTMYAAYSGVVEFAGEIVHGKTSAIQHDGKGLYAGLDPEGVIGTRYHSLAANISTIPLQLAVTSKTDSGVVMGIRHTRYAMEAIQFHPEGILSRSGKDMIANFLSWTSGLWEGCPQAQIQPQDVAQSEKSSTPEMTMCSPKAAARKVLDPEEALKAAVTSALSTEDAALAAAQGAKEAVVLPATKGADGKTILQRIHDQRKLDIAASAAVPGQALAELEASIAMHLAPPLVSVLQRLRTRKAQGRIAVMAEMKRASPSKGLIDPEAHAGKQALAYAQAGASVISVLTEQHWFKGTLQDLRLARAAVEGMRDRPALLRKDFVVDKHQIAEARLAGADTVLLIVAMFPNKTPAGEGDAALKALYDYSVSLGMEPLVEVNNAAEMARAAQLGSKLIGVNNRNLHDFNVDMGTTSRLISAAQESREGEPPFLAALSGITSRADVQKYIDEGVQAVLVGEALMRAEDKRAFMNHLMGLPPSPQAAPQTPLVKICGLRDASAALVAARAGADLLGLILVPGTKRSISTEQAREIIRAVRSESRGASIASGGAKQESAPDSATWFEDSARHLRSTRTPLIVGVFRNQSLEDVRHVADELDLDVVQLHGSVAEEPLEWARSLSGKWVMQIFSVPPGASGTEAELQAAFHPTYHHLVGLDAGAGGTGQSFDWAVAKRLAGQKPFLLAGGLTAENVQQAIKAAGPGTLIVDTSSGVETDGVKDHKKIQAFVAAAKTAQA